MSCIKESIQAQSINVLGELIILTDAGLITRESQSKLTQKGEDILSKFEYKKSGINKEELIENINKYLELWPKGKLPSGKQARTAVGNLESGFVWFLKTYPDYSWETILKATEHYVDEYERKNYLYMKSSQYFIRKQLSDKSWDSELANYCNMIITGDIENSGEIFHDKVV